MALGACHANVAVVTSYPGTPATEILTELSKEKDIYTEWSINEKVALEVAMGASYSGVRVLCAMKHVGLNVAADPLFAVSTTGIKGGFVIVSCDDPGYHSSQGEQDNRHYARFAKIPMLEPTDSQEAYDIMGWAFQISEQFDTPVLVRSTTRISHCKTMVYVKPKKPAVDMVPSFFPDPEKYVMVPSYVRSRRYAMEERIHDFRIYAEAFPLNEMILNDRKLGIISSGVAYQYAREVFRESSFLKLVTTYPVPENLIRKFAQEVEALLVVEELDPFLEQEIRSLGIPVRGKDLFSLVGELSVEAVEKGAANAGYIPANVSGLEKENADLPFRPPRLCAGCPHMGIGFVLGKHGLHTSDEKGTAGSGKNGIVVAGDIGCYTLSTYAPLRALDTTACMGASIGHAMGLVKAGVQNKVVAVIGDSTFMHSGITGLINGVYNQSDITVIILDNRTTAMTGLQGHPGTGILATGEKGKSVELESLIKGIGIEDVNLVNAFDLEAIESTLVKCLNTKGVCVMIVRGPCALQTDRSGPALFVDEEICTKCEICLQTGCPALTMPNGKPGIERNLCLGDACGVCAQLCPVGAIQKEAL